MIDPILIRFGRFRRCLFDEAFRGGEPELLTLPLLELGVFLVDHVQFTFTANDLAIDRTLFNGRSDFHDGSYCSVYKNSC